MNRPRRRRIFYTELNYEKYKGTNTRKEMLITGANAKEPKTDVIAQDGGR